MAGTGKLKRQREQAADAAAPSEPAETALEVSKSAKPERNESTERVPKRARVEATKSLFVRSLPQTATSETLTDFFSQHYPVKHATVVLDPTTKASRGYGFVTFTDPDDAVDAKEKLQNKKLDGRPIRLEIADSRQRRPTAGSVEAESQKEKRKTDLAEARKAPKLIVRNLPWSIKTSEQLGAMFRAFGKVKFADLPQAKGKLSGFGFVTLRGRQNAQKALDTINGKEVDGRTLAVDWAVGKEEWDKLQPAKDVSKENAQEVTKNPKKSDGRSAKHKTDDQDVEEDEDKDKDDEEEEEDEDLRNFMKNHVENLEDEESDVEDKEENEDELHVEDETEDAPQKPLMTSNLTTLFVRNLPFSTTDADLKSHFEQFGAIRYARVVVDRATDRPAGTGFVCFFKEEESKACLKGAPRPRAPDPSGKRSILQDEMADEQGLYTIEGRILQVSQAVSKDEASRLTATGVAARDGKDRDKRRLYLLAEGSIPASSPLHALLTPGEVQMRDDSVAQRKKLIQGNPSLHLSLTRLAIRNIPRNITSKELKALAREAIVGFAKDVKEGRRQPLSKEEAIRGGIEDREAEKKRKEKGKGIVKQTKVVFENQEGSKVGEGDGAGKSRGYGFIEYTSHRWALMGLRWLNGHTLKTTEGKPQRLIVEFAIENAQVVARRKDGQAKFVGGYQNSRRSDEAHSASNRGGSDFKGRPSKGGRPGKSLAPSGDAQGDADASSKPAKGVSRHSLEQNIIQRKRVMRKKKANSRG